MTHICVSKQTIIGSDNGLSPDRRQTTIWTNVGLLLIEPLGTNFSEILIEILTFSFKKMRLKVSSAKRRPFCLGLNVLMTSCHANALRITTCRLLWEDPTVITPHKGSLMRYFDVFVCISICNLLLSPISCWTYRQVAFDLICYDAHVTSLLCLCMIIRVV